MEGLNNKLQKIATDAPHISRSLANCRISGVAGTRLSPAECAGMHSDVMRAKSDQGFAFRYAAATPSPYFPTPGGTMCRAHVLTQERCIAAGLHQPFAKERSIGSIFLWSILGSGTHFLMGSSYYSMVRVCLGLVVVLADGITEEFRLGLPLPPLMLLAVLVEFVEAYERDHSGASPRSVDVTRRRLRWTSRSTASILSDPGSERIKGLLSLQLPMEVRIRILRILMQQLG